MSPVTAIRFGLPALLVVLGVGLILLGDDAAIGAGVVIAGCAVLVSMANLLVRFSVSEMKDRTRDQDARDFYGAHGHWPDEPAREPEPADPPSAAPPPPEHPGVISKPAGDRGGRTRPLRPRRPPRRRHREP